MDIYDVGGSTFRSVKVPFYYDAGVLAVHQAYYDVGFRTDRWNVTHKATGARVGPIFDDMGSALIYANRIYGILPANVTAEDVLNSDTKHALSELLHGLEYTGDHQPASIERGLRAQEEQCASTFL